ncbi:conserved hypothetical protein [Theileria orientalis strain Shintoku]|uniref:EF-hand domain-containing protein n=1 Tax=Theileria orientalis strain Shintoku TaxID=869250 RepID=J4C4F4_THEOR|nr:conserved hypothetical protein [Theileria orientalis strain Shintoku]BAM42091.1 conserved hypothetical protein [Theileria orientalis strain Shintoku]|eukprot:XP_009692392.1 conserved hypothetical protein [Theileria orientalis strain Shintoku]
MRPTLLLVALFVGTSISQTITYTAESVKANTSNVANLAVRNRLATDVLRNKYQSVDLTRDSAVQGSTNQPNGHNLDSSLRKLGAQAPSSDGSIRDRLRGWSTVVVVVVVLTSTFAILMMTLFKLIEGKIEDTQDLFLKNAFNMCFRQIALIGVINLVLWLILQTRIATKLDNIIFKQNRNLPHLKNNTNSIVEPIFECLLSISVILLAWYLVYVVYFQFIVRRTIAWMRKTDNSDVLTTAKEVEFLEKSFCNRLWNPGVLRRGKFLANRFEFIDNINAMSLPKNDPGGYYFMEYLRANLLDISVQMLRFPRAVFVFVILFSVVLRNTLNFEGMNEVMVLSVFSTLCALSMLLLHIYVFLIEDKLYPSKLSQYLILKHNTNDMEISKFFNQSLLPPYKLAQLEDEPNNFLTKLVHGDAPVNKHEDLFLFKSKGPKILVKLFELICFSLMIILAIWVYLVQQHQNTWLIHFRFGNPIILCNLGVVAFLIPKILYSLIVVGKTGLLIELDTLEKVWESNRSNNTRHAMELIDALNLDAVETSLKRNGDTYWRHLLAKLKTSPLAVQKQMNDIWCSLDSKKKGVIGMTKILRFMSSQGLQITNKKRIKEFIKSFTRTKPYTLTEEEFLVLGLVVKQIIVIPLDISQMKILFEQVYGIPWTSAYGIDSDSLQTIIKHLGLKWNEGDRRHLLDFLSGGRCDGMSPENFIEQLSTVELLLKPNESNSFSLEV